MKLPDLASVVLYRCADLVPGTKARCRLRELALRVRHLRAHELVDEVLASANRVNFYTADERAAFELAAEELSR